MEKPKIPDKLVYKLAEASRITKVKPDVISAWEKEFYFIQAGRTAGGDRIFRKKDLEIITRLKELLENQNLTLAGAKRRIEEEFGFVTPASIHPDRLKKAIGLIREGLQEIADLIGEDEKK
ncbi:MAG: MerR family transcriptional regulator [Candidatus Aminicenantes bacterium]|nr:MerR family transcriptional regulator [Candidatus Aminicenantes bacterium]